MKNRTGRLSRRELLQWGGALGLAMGLAPWQALRAASMSSLGNGTPDDPLELTIAQWPLRIAERRSTAVALNGQVPGPLIRLREGQDFVARVHNRLDQETSIHWHGLLLPAGMDGVPGVSFAGIRPGATFTYRFPIRQHGTYWYHSHSGMQEQRGHYGALIIDPAGPDPVAFEREHVVVLSALVQIGIHHIPATQTIFQIGALSLADCGLVLALGLLPVTVLELAKLLRRRSTAPVEPSRMEP